VTFPAYPGHFDGNPLVPGAALLEWVAAETGATRFARVRFLAPVRPGEEVALTVTGEAFTVTGPHGVVMRGALAR
jgi:3-hydroxymyristoyl/3-hydroxydecanoyl-(acyl carrier protein) dehydratase